MKIINFLNVTVNLSTGKYQPYSKPNNVPLYVNNKSNHPPNILRNIPLSINKRLSQISSDKDSFNNTSAEYQRAIYSGYNHKLQFDHPSLSTPASKPKSRKRNVTWYNPPFSKNVKTNIGQSFLKIIDEEFPTSNPLHKIFNRNTLKISYCCMPNIKQTLDGHNKVILSKSVKPKTTATTCNCRKTNECPLSKKCSTESVVYQATVTSTSADSPQTYIGLTENSFKTRYTNHKASFKKYNKRNATELSQYIWHLQANNINYNIKWRILKRARPYNPISKRCNLCLWEKYFIVFKPEMASLKKRNELVSSCRHANKFLLKAFN